MNSKINFVVFIILISIIGCKSDKNTTTQVSNVGNEPYEYKIPTQMQDGWQTASVSDVGINQNIIEQMVQKATLGSFGAIESIVIAKDGYLIHESYFRGSSSNKLNDTRSVTKSIISTVIGIAVDAGYIASMDDKIMPLFPEYEIDDNSLEQKNNISIRHLLTMSSGLDCNDNDFYSIGRESLMFKSDDWLKYFLTLPSIREPGVLFSYCAGGVVGLAGVIEKTTNMKGIDFADKYLLKPLNITNYNWIKTAGGLLHPNGLFINSRDMAKLGQIMLTGTWDGEIILSQDWIEQASSHQFWDADFDSMGFLWWRADSNSIGIDTDLFYAHGYGGQSIVVIPEYSTVVVITAHNEPDRALQLNSKIIIDYILPAFK